VPEEVALVPPCGGESLDSFTTKQRAGLTDILELGSSGISPVPPCSIHVDRANNQQTN
jgi:hypothetical protein